MSSVLVLAPRLLLHIHMQGLALAWDGDPGPTLATDGKGSTVI